MPSASTPDLALPHAAYAKISPSPYLTAHLLPAEPSISPIRPNGRAPSAFRPPTCHAGSLSHCAGSAVVRVGHTAVVCGITAETLRAQEIPNPAHTYDPTRTGDPADADADALADLNLLVPNVELATGCSPAHLPGGAPSNTAQTLAARLLRLLLASRLINLDSLRIKHTPRKLADDDDEPQEQTVAYWTLYPSVHVMSLAGESSLFDCAWAAMLAALRDVRLPRAWWDADFETVVCSDRTDEATRLPLAGLPIAATIGVFVAAPQQVKALEELRGQEAGDNGMALDGDRRAWLLADPDEFEDELCREAITVVVDCSAASKPSRILRIEKSGGGVIGAAEMPHVIAAAEGRWREWKAVLP